ncbi:OmpA family protein [Crocinitomix algicola]|uniref:OmpA family protein n=1 Tax=Crocinitomix algicola TaxID=1740263 RepID=UPI00082DF6E2|nr:OmpA family protein [Crocinitomix algicola]
MLNKVGQNIERVIILCLFILSSGISVHGQIMLSKEKAVKKAFLDYNYPRAIEIYQYYEANTIEQKRQKALSYWYVNQPEKADSIYQNILKTKEFTKEDVINYSLILGELERYDESERWMKKYHELDKNDLRGQLYRTRPKAHTYLSRRNDNFRVKNLSINSKDQDFAPTFYKNKVVFTSTRQKVSPVARTYNKNKLNFLDVYIADRDSTFELSNPHSFSTTVNKKFHEGPVCFSPKGDKMYLTRNNYNGRSANGTMNLQLVVCDWEGDDWSSPIELPFNSLEYSVGHASISEDGKTLYFASNMPGGMGGTDLYKVAVHPDGTYGEPVNLGINVNTEGDESFPFIHPGNEMLFFASNGRVGLGGMDVYMAQVRKDESIVKVMNLGAPINSSGDDFGFILDSIQTYGYFSSNRTGGRGNDDIYGFELTKPFVIGKVIKGTVNDEKGNPLANTEITLFNLLSGETEIIMTSEDGLFEFVVESDNTFNLRGYKQKYLVQTKTIDTYTKAEVIQKDLVLIKDSGLQLSAFVKDKVTNRPLLDVKLTIIDNDTQKKTEVYTPVSGLFEMPVQNKKLNDKGNYTIQLSKDGYISKSLNYQPHFNRLGKYEIHRTLDLSMDPIKIGADLSKMIEIEPILFDVDKAEIRPDAALQLDKIVQVMNENPSMVIELGSHTDSRGSAAKNANLSSQRAKASANYIAERISNPSRISGKGFGESRPNTVLLKTEDGDERKVLTEDFINSYRIKNPDLFEKFHQMNRRTEFIIVRM